MNGGDAPAGGAAAAAAAPAGNQQQRGNIFGTISRWLLMYFMVSYFFKGRTPAADPSTGKPLPPHACMWPRGAAMDLRVYISENETFDRTLKEASQYLVWQEKNLFFDLEETNTRHKDIIIPASENVQNNASLYAHIYFVPLEAVPRLPTIYRAHRLNKYLPRPQMVTRHNLISGETQVVENIKATGNVDLISFWKPNMTINLVSDPQTFSRGALPSQLTEFMKFDSTETNYEPILMMNEFWLMREHFYPINDTVKSLNLSMEYYPLSMFKWQLYIQMDQSFQMQMSMGSVESETDDFKRMLLDTNPYLLGVTAVVSLLHMIFDFLAFKNDISFWKNNKSMEGLSVRTIFLNTFCQVVIFLYLVDNDTSWMILLSSGIGLLIEFWKINKAVILNLKWKGWIPVVGYTDRKSYAASTTKEFDEHAMKYLSYVLYALVVCYSIYSLMYETHKSWYSWVLASLTGTVYTFGFIMMTPQIWVNYKRRSVPPLPWRTFTYKALNTFIDDLFAFIIKMPTLHRLSCFRDDIVFFILLYQRWKYPVDPRRTHDEDEDEKTATTPTLTPGSSTDDANSSGKPKTE